MSNVSEKPYKRKKRKTFLTNARKYGKKGCYGRGSELDSETYQYLVRIMEAYREGFPSDEDKLLFVNNVFEQIEENAIECSCNQVGCRVIEMLLPFANDSTLQKYMQAFGSEMRPLCSDRFASHIMQTLVDEACKKSLASDTEEDFKKNCKDFTLKVSRFMLNNLEDYVWDTYGNHIIRTIFINLAQLPKEENKSNIHHAAKLPKTSSSDVEIPAEYTEVLKEYAVRLISWPQFNTLPDTEITSGMLQTLLKVLAKLDTKQLQTYLKKLLNENFAPESVTAEDDVKQQHMECSSTLSHVFTSKPAMMLLETALEIATPKMYTQIYAKCFTGKLVTLAATRNTNFAVQKLLSNCSEKVEFEAMFEELAEHFKAIVIAGHSGVILSLAQGCKKLAAKQGSFVQNLMKALDCYEPEENQNHFVICVSKFLSLDNEQAKNYENLEKEKLSLHGTLIVQLMLEFNKPIKIVNSLLNMGSAGLKNLFSNTMGSHIVDSYVRSEFVGEKSREKLVRTMQGTYQELASTKFGSRSFEAIWSAAGLKQKLYIMNELTYKDAAWSNSQFGKIIAGKVNLMLYKKNKEDWKTSFNAGSKVKVKALFADILEK